MRLSVLSSALAFLLVVSGCKTSENATSSRSRGTIDRAEIESSGLTFAHAYDMVRQLRPAWLVERGISTLVPNRASDTLLDYIAVYVDRNLTGDPESLRRVSAMDVDTIEFLNTARAQRLGSRSHIHGAIVVTTRRQ
ncbi:MAG: hypothetical protein OXM02_14445 [Bacteroidota bacterium]|nr:hypothetical protein [Bacteroidota bacterium]MDE2835700.1 hypothetical protein [Bacteroidota bacterium]MDE2957985.1 hypothetical protein [Bacteroidota bacterium]